MNQEFQLKPCKSSNWAAVWAEKIMRREPSKIIGGEQDPYLLRWHLIPRNKFFNIYLHRFVRSDDDRALHDHPWLNLSILIKGEYTEHTISDGGIHRRKKLKAGTVKARLPWAAHRIELHDSDNPPWTLFVTGPVIRDWGFHCSEIGWVHWQDFTENNGLTVGKGCDQ